MNRLSKTLYYIAVFFVMLLFSGTSVFAATDDPGQGRLSGKSISEDFYESENPEAPFFLRSAVGTTSVSPYTGLTYTHGERVSSRTMKHGIDVSQWQQTIDWAKVKAAGIDYAFVRVGYRGYSAGTLSESTKDSYYETNMKNATAAGIKVGVYIFSQAITVEEAKEEADYILDHLGNYKISMPLIMDYEYVSGTTDGGRLKTANLTKEQATAICKAFCKRIKDAGYTPMVYANKSMLENQLDASKLTGTGYRIWLANYTTATAYTGEYDFWQYSSSGKVDGISGNVDMNFYYKQSTDKFTKGQISISKATIKEVENQIYDGKAKQPAVEVAYKSTKLVKGTDYSLSYKNNAKPGLATITIKGKGNYNGSVDVHFVIKPKKMAAPESRKKATDYIRIGWDKATTGVSGYEVYRSGCSTKYFEKVATIKSPDTVTYTDKDLKEGAYYFYKIRSFVTVNNKRYYGAFSPITKLYTRTSYDRAGITKQSCKMYSGIKDGATAVISVAANEILSIGNSIIDTNNVKWYEVSVKKEDVTYSGYIKSSKINVGYVGKTVNKSTVAVYESSSKTSKKLTTIPKNTAVYILKSKNTGNTTWYKVICFKADKMYTGWISSPYIKC